MDEQSRSIWQAVQLRLACVLGVVLFGAGSYGACPWYDRVGTVEWARRVPQGIPVDLDKMMCTRVVGQWLFVKDPWASNTATLPVFVRAATEPILPRYSLEVIGRVRDVRGRRVVVATGLRLYTSESGRPQILLPKGPRAEAWPWMKELIPAVTTASARPLDELPPVPEEDEGTGRPRPPFGGYNDVPDGGYVEINQSIVMEEFWAAADDHDTFYVERFDRSGGVRVRSGWYCYEGDVISLYGTMSTDESGNREIIIGAGYTWANGVPMPNSLAMNQRALTTGLVPSGVRVRLSGIVTQSAAWSDPEKQSYFYLDDGSGLPNDTGAVTGIKVYEPYIPYVPHEAGEVLSIAGVLAKEKTLDGSTIPVLLEAYFDDNTGTPGSQRYAVTGTVTADTDAAGQTVRVCCDAGQTSCVLDSTGVGQYSLLLPGSPAEQGGRLYVL